MKQAMNFKCNSPKMVCDLLKKYVGNGPAQDDIVALDIGAGNGMVGEHLSDMGRRPSWRWILFPKPQTPWNETGPVFMMRIMWPT
jgi:hypothetical protein